MSRRIDKGKRRGYASAGLVTLLIAIAGTAYGETLDSTASAGKRLAVAADCVACHTAPGGRAFAGGYPLGSPMGTIYSTNITPSKTAASAITRLSNSPVRCVTGWRPMALGFTRRCPTPPIRR